MQSTHKSPHSQLGGTISLRQFSIATPAAFSFGSTSSASNIAADGNGTEPGQVRQSLLFGVLILSETYDAVQPGGRRREFIRKADIPRITLIQI